MGFGAGISVWGGSSKNRRDRVGVGGVLSHNLTQVRLQSPGLGLIKQVSWQDI